MTKSKKGPNKWKKEWNGKFKELLRLGIIDIDNIHNIKKPALEQAVRSKYFPTYRYYDLFQAKVRRAAGKVRVDREVARHRKRVGKK